VHQKGGKRRVMKKVKDFMVEEIPTLTEQTSIRTILELFSNSGHNILPVVNGERKLVGLISLGDLLDDLLFSKEEISILEKVSFLADFLTDVVENIEHISPLVLARDIMQTTVCSIREEDSMLKAAVMMKKKNIHRLIVVNKDNVPVGYVSRNEICKAFVI